MSKSYIGSIILIITGVNLNPDRVSYAMGVDPDQAWEKGDKKIFENGDEFIYKWGGWKLYAPHEICERNIEGQIGFWIDFLSKRIDAVEKISRLSNDITLDCYVSIGDSSVIGLDYGLICELARLRARVVFSIFTQQSENIGA